MAKIRNISPDTLVIGGPNGKRTVEPDATVDVFDDDLSAYVERVDGIPGEFDENGDQKFKVVPSDLWVEVPDIKPAKAVAASSDA